MINLSATSPELNVYISDITQDKEGNLWLATHNGLIRYNPLEKKARRFTIQNNHKEIFEVNTLHIDSSNTMWIGSMNGLFIMDLKKRTSKLTL